MAIRNILKEKTDSATLRRKSRPVEAIDARILTLLDDMGETLEKVEGVGLAAPQIGVLRRVVIVDIGDGKIEMINPEIIEKKGRIREAEGCLSIPGLNGYVARPEKLIVRFRDRSFQEQTLEATDFLARAICHEVDHLNGVLFTDVSDDIYKV